MLVAETRCTPFVNAALAVQVVRKGASGENNSYQTVVLGKVLGCGLLSEMRQDAIIQQSVRRAVGSLKEVMKVWRQCKMYKMLGCSIELAKLMCNACGLNC